MTLTWIIVACAFITGGTAACIHAANPSTEAFWTAVVASGIGFGGLLLEARRDAYSAGLFFCALGSVTGLLAGAIVSFGVGSHPVSEALLVLGIAGAIASVAYLIWLPRSPEGLPNFLRDNFDDREILENGGLQFVAAVPTGEVMAGERIELRFLLQNCWDAVRKARFTLTATKESTDLCFCETLLLEVPPLAVVELCVPVASLPSSLGPFSLLFGLRGFGSGGRRLRHWRGKHFDPPISKGTQIAGALVGVFASGGGWRLKGEVLPRAEGESTAEATEDWALPDPEVEVLWQPENSPEIKVELPELGGRGGDPRETTTPGPKPPKSFAHRYGAFIGTAAIVGVLAVLGYLSTSHYQAGVALDEARELEAAGDQQGAVATYERLVNDYPQTDATREAAKVLTRFYCATVREPLTLNGVEEAEGALARFAALKFQAREAAGRDMGEVLTRWLDQLGHDSDASARASLQLLDRSGSILDPTVQQALRRRREHLEQRLR